MKSLDVQLTDLPTELLVLILSYLPPSDLLSCNLVNSPFYTIISNSVYLQYNIELYKACALDNKGCNLSCAEKLTMLQKREEAWSNCTPSFHRIVPLDFTPGSVYDFSSAVYLLGDYTRQRLHYLRLPHLPNREPQWSVFPSDDNRHIVDFGLNLHEHDLIALVTAELHSQSTSSSSAMLSIDLSLRQFSTGDHHPLAKVPSIHVVVSELRWGSPSINLEIVGKYLALVTTFWRNPNSKCMVTVYEWQTGKVVMDINGRPESYSGVVFISENIILLPNTETRALELWKIPGPNEHSPSSPLRQLALPRLMPHNVLRFISCRGEPNPSGSIHDPKYSDRPFHYDPLDSILLLHLRVQGIHLSSLFTIFIHRRSLLNLLPPHAPFVDIDVEKPVPWAEWAPPITFCIDLGGGIPSRWITTTCGQRFVVLPGPGDDVDDSDTPEDDLRRKPRAIVVFDFNLHNVRKAERELEVDPDATTKIVSREKKVMDAQEIFAEDIVSCLPYVVSATTKKYRLDGVLMDEDRVLGLQTDVDGHIKYIEVFHFG
ncbi:MAG: hypothetical protein NXY57DRAFT_1115551 [Lentinula lateritia]|uniref:F-box domain-containing protein n=1 Tax=Lentinula lateritia TaxID=40482 RepID=A0ABQ8VXN4_9AGAR|nr:hypothetical protein EV359DRAFT_80596 [Lentinula novae-zelandiae]KAJ3933818.1 MAG: hypothetical protein NXY57DRAFT_1115551 [Lentinula lateritia]KAJ4501156.1 hypothetical protein C8R41DRAFT_913735 [Lentinula lateritia]